MPAPKKPRRKTAFVPRVIFKAVAAVGVVPLCVSACGGIAGGPLNEAGPDVAASCFGQNVPPGCPPPDAGNPDDARPDVQFTVAAVCFDGSGPGCPPPLDAGHDVLLGVAAVCFDGGPFCPDAFGVADAGFSDVLPGVAFDAFALDAGKGKG